MSAEPQTSRSLRRSFIWPTVCHLALQTFHDATRARERRGSSHAPLLACAHIHEKGFV